MMATEPAPPYSPIPMRRRARWLRKTSWVKHYFWPTSTLIAIGLCFLSVVIFFGNYHSLLDLLSHFRWFYMLAAIGLIAIGCFGRRSLIIGAALVASLVNASQMTPYWVPKAMSETAAKTSSVRLMAANVWAENTNPQKLFDAVQQANADILVLCEMNQKNQHALYSLRDDYPYVTQHSNARIFIFSRIPIQSSRYLDHHIGTYPQPVAVFQVDGREFAVIGIHTATPLTNVGWKQRNLEMNRTADSVRQLDMPVIVTGDMNITCFSANFRNFLVDAGLQDGRIGQGLYATWPVFIPFVQIPIDQFVATPDIEVTRFVNGSYTGSDHRPIVIDFNLTIEP